MTYIDMGSSADEKRNPALARLHGKNSGKCRHSSSPENPSRPTPVCQGLIHVAECTLEWVLWLLPWVIRD